MRRGILVCGLLLTVSLPSYADDKKPDVKLPTPPTNASLEKMKKLAGTWLVADKDGKPTDQVASIIKVTAGGSVVHETLFPGQPHEMVSIYTVEGSDLIMTHYCVLGNQPRLRPTRQPPTSRLFGVLAAVPISTPRRTSICTKRPSPS